MGGANQVQAGSFFGGRISVGFGTRFGASSYVAGDVTVGRYVSFGPQIALISHDRHPLETPALYVSPPLPRPLTRSGAGWTAAGRLSVGHDVWIGRGATVLGAVVVGNGAVIGANSVVTSDVAPFTIVAGAPARQIRPRFDDELIDLLQQWAWWELDDAELEVSGELLDLDLTTYRDRAVQLLQEAIQRRG